MNGFSASPCENMRKSRNDILFPFPSSLLFLVHRHDFFILLNNYHWLFHLQAPFQMIRSFPYRISSSFHSICALVVFTANLLCQAHLLKWVKIIIHPFLAAWYDYFSVISALLFEKTIITYNVSSSLILASCFVPPLLCFSKWI